MCLASPLCRRASRNLDPIGGTCIMPSGSEEMEKLTLRLPSFARMHAQQMHSTLFFEPWPERPEEVSSRDGYSFLSRLVPIPIEKDHPSMNFPMTYRSGSSADQVVLADGRRSEERRLPRRWLSSWPSICHKNKSTHARCTTCSTACGFFLISSSRTCSYIRAGSTPSMAFAATYTTTCDRGAECSVSLSHGQAF